MPGKENLDLLEQGPHGIVQVMMTFLLFAPASKRWLGWRKTENPEGSAQVHFVTFIVQSYFDWRRYSFALRVISDILGAAVLKVMDQKTLVKRRWSLKVHITGYIKTHFESLPDTISKIFDQEQFARHSLFEGIRLSPQTSKTVSESTATIAYPWQNHGRLQRFADN